MVAAVPITMQVPNEREMPPSISFHSSSPMRPARFSSQYFHASEPEPMLRGNWRGNVGGWFDERLSERHRRQLDRKAAGLVDAAFDVFGTIAQMPVASVD